MQILDTFSHFQTRTVMKRIQQLLFFLTATLVALTGCRESPTEEAVAPRGVAVEIAVRPDGMQEQTRSTDEEAIDDLNFYLYDDQGSLLLHRYQQATTLRFEVVPGHYRMRLAANLGRDLGENPSEEELRISGAESYERLPMAAEEEFDVTSAGASCSTIEVRRCVAKVSYEINVKDPNIELRSVQLISLPRTAALFDAQAAPSSDPADYTDSSETTLSGTAASGACYLLPNLQGTVPSITDQRQKSPEHAPEHASYLLIRATNGSRNLLYTVYLGGNNTSDFNVRANVHYTFRISILGDDEIDTRVYSYSIQVWDDFDDYRFGVKNIIVKEHLGRHKITARFHFFFQMPDIHRLVDRFHMSLRIAGCADAQLRAGLTDLADQLGCILIIFFYLAVFRNIAAKCQDILNSVCLNLAQDTVHLLTGRGDAGQM